jgi:hypothetical protein
MHPDMECTEHELHAEICVNAQFVALNRLTLERVGHYVHLAGALPS